MTTQKTRVYSTFDPPPQELLVCQDKSLTKQSEADSCDINKIVERFEKTGILPNVNETPALYIDATKMPDYRTALDQVNMANEYFSHLNAKIRAMFDNDPAQFLDFVSNEDNHQHMVELGLREPDPITEVPLVVPTPEPEVSATPTSSP